MRTSIFGGYSSIPQELKELRQWIVWRYEDGAKIPYTTCGKRAKTNDQSTWGTFGEAVAVADHFEGVAFVFSDSDGYCGVDLDDCVVDKIVEPWAEEILRKFSGVAYIELSPSGTGVKLITRAKKPAGSRCANKQGIECYDNRRYWAITGFALEECIGDGQAAVDWLCAEYLAGEQTQSRDRQPQPIIKFDGIDPDYTDLFGRAELYIASCDRGVLGDLRNHAFRISGHLHSLRGSYGEKLSESDVRALLGVWNLGNADMLRGEELDEAARNGAKNGVPRAEKLCETQARVVDSIPDVQVERKPETSFPSDLMEVGGVLGGIVEHTLSQSLYPQPELALAGAISLVAAICGRKLRDEDDTRTNLYVCGLAESGSGKESARATNKQLLLLAGGEGILGPERIASSAGLVSYTAKKLSPLFQVDEIGRLLATMRAGGADSPHLFNIATVLMHLYTSSRGLWMGDAYADIEKNPVIQQPNLCLYGTSVPENFWGGLSKESLTDGLVSRFLIFEGRPRPQRKKPKISTPKDWLLSAIRWWVEFGGDFQDTTPTQVTATRSQQAESLFESYLDHVDAQCRSGHFAWTRSGEKVAKVALIAAASNNPETTKIEISEPEMLFAVRLVEHLTISTEQKCEKFVSENRNEADIQKIASILDGGKIKMQQLVARTRGLDKRRRSEAISHLIETGQVEMLVERQDAGRPVTWLVCKE